jgi:2-octaprenyl-6-methoxyphenol hydroxylase
MNSQQQCDVAIVGGGPVGTALALALRDSELKVVMLEARAASAYQADPRALALSYGSRLLLDKLAVWSHITAVSPIKEILISQKNTRGYSLLQASEMHVPALGYVLPYSALQTALQHALQESTVSYLDEARVSELETSAAQATLTYHREGVDVQLQARLVVVADGGKLLEQSHPPIVREYGQSAVIAHVTCSRPQVATAFERFTPQGPLALLPFQDGYEIVWTASHEQANEMLTWSDETFLSQLQQHFGDEVGEFKTVGTRSQFPLRLKKAAHNTLPHTALIGNAAQTLHPVAGQGFNMGVRDAWELARIILRTPKDELGSVEMLNRFRRQRALDRHAGIGFTDSLVRVFSNDWPVLTQGRGLALAWLDHVSPIKKFVAKRMMFGANG